MTMQTPIVDFAKNYAQSDALRLHMPGHKGVGQVQAFDLTEIEGADVLYHANGIIRQSEDNAASIFGTKRTVYSAEGSSLAIRAMLYLTKLYAATLGRNAKILAARNAHKTFVTAAALLNIDVRWIFPETAESIVSCDISADFLDKALADEMPTAVYLTSPDYLGNLADIQRLSAVCRKHGVLLLVDNAHGAYLRFLKKHPIELGADMCCDSAHKTLPVLTGGAYLHISENAPPLFSEQADVAMSIFASTSPSYLILQSLDAANRYLSDGYASRLAYFSEKIEDLKVRLQRKGWKLCGDEVLKLTLAPKSYGYTGDEIAQILRGENIVCEFSDPDYIVMMLSAEMTDEEILRLENALNIKKRTAIKTSSPHLPKPQQVLSMHEALFAPNEELALNDCIGKVLAAPCITCPPAVGVLVCGERIDETAAECMHYYGINRCRVVK